MTDDHKFRTITVGLAAVTTLTALAHAHDEACAAVYRTQLQCSSHNDLPGDGHGRNPLRTPWATATTSSATAEPGLADWILFSPGVPQR